MFALSALEPEFRHALDDVLARIDWLFASGTLNSAQLHDLALMREGVEHLRFIFDDPQTHFQRVANGTGLVPGQIAHELRTPLNDIIGFSFTLLQYPAMYDGAGLDYSQHHQLSAINALGNTLLNLVQDAFGCAA